MKITSFLEKRLKDLRLVSKFTHEQVAKILKVSEKKVIAWENGKIEPTAEELIKLSFLYKVTIDYLFGLEGTITKRDTSVLPLKENETSQSEKMFLGKYRLLKDSEKIIAELFIDHYIESSTQQ